MEQFIGCDAHKKFSVFVAVNEKGQAGGALRVNHERPLYREFLARLPPGSAIAVEASGSYGWLVDEMERSGHHPKLCNPHEAKRRMGLSNKTDKLDAKGLAILLGNGTGGFTASTTFSVGSSSKASQPLRCAGTGSTI